MEFLKKIFLFFLFIFPLLAFSQQGEIKGVVKDAASGETLIGANVLIAAGKGAVTDLNGNFSIVADIGDYVLTVSFVGYKTQTAKIKLSGSPVTINFSLENQTLNEVEIIADVAVDRETPIAFSTIPTLKVQQELGSRDLPMILNSTPGVYATEQGGGSGDARISIRGFDQKNVAVMVDGVPVNDMENGLVYWSNWDGLGDITRSVQVQRGLGASKLALASVGGTMNTITRGIESRKGGSVKQEFGNNNFLKTSLSYNSGLLKNGFGVTFAATYKTTDGWADKTWAQAYSYFIKIQKNFGKHLLSLGANGAPQKHGMRENQQPIANFDREYAEKLHINVDSIYNTNATVRSRGFQYNPNWGQYTDSTGVVHIVTEKINYYHKPLFNFSDFWRPGEKIYVSNVAYLSIGNGGGTSVKSGSSIPTNAEGQQDYQAAYNANISYFDKSIDSAFSQSKTIIRSSRNDHFWYGLLSTVNFAPSKLISFDFGIDARSYKGTHFQIVYDLLGGNYFKDISDANQPRGVLPGDPNYQYSKKEVGDKITHNTLGYYVSLINWGGIFGQVEIKTGRWNFFVSLTGSQTGYQRIDYFKRKDLIIDGKVYEQAVGWGDTLFYNGTDTLLALRGTKISHSGDTTILSKGNYKKTILHANNYVNNSPEARFATSDWKWFSGYTLKGGMNYNMTEHQNIFTNFGYLSLAPRFDNVFDRNNHLLWDIQNQFVYAIEVGYGTNYKKFAANLNGYYSIWENKPPDFSSNVIDKNGDVVTYNINGLDALHQGIEADFILKPFNNFELAGLASFGDWIYTSNDTVLVTDEQGNVLNTVAFLAKGIHVGNAAQMQYGASVRFEFLKNCYVKTGATYFGKNYSDFDPTTLFGYNANRESWKMPNYIILDAFAGYEIKGENNLRYSLSAGVFNLLNTMYISDAKNNGVFAGFNPPLGKGFDATSATVFFAQGRRFNIGLKVSF